MALSVSFPMISTPYLTSMGTSEATLDAIRQPELILYY